MKKIEIIYWSDYACPFCYIGERNLKTAMAELGLTENCDLKMRAFELHPGAPDTCMGKTVELLARKYNLTLEESMRQIKRIEAMGREAGINFDYEHTKYTSTFDAHRLTKYAQAVAGDEMVDIAGEKAASVDLDAVNGDEKVDILIEKLFKALFEDGESLADRRTLVRLAVEAGLSKSEVEAVLDSDAYSNEVRADEAVAAQQNIHGVPYFVMGNRYIVPGALPVADMKDVLKKLVEELGIEVENKSKSKNENGTLCINEDDNSETSTGGCCGINGCE